MCGLALAVGGCTTVQHTTVVEQASSATMVADDVGPGIPPRHAAVPSPCEARPGTGPFEHLPHVLASTPVPVPKQALAERVSGSAGVQFRIGPQGRPQDVAVVAEYPAGYGFGDAAREAVTTSRWPARDDLAWRYLAINMYPHAAS